MGKNGDGRDSLLIRGVQILQSFRPSGSPQSLSEISRRTSLPKSTCHRIIEMLLDAGLVERTLDGLVLGHTLFELGELVPIKLRLRETALPFMQDLYEATHETVHLAVRDGLDVLYAEKIRGHAGLDTPSRVGGRLPLSSTAVGKTLLAYSGPALLGEVTSRPLRTLTRYSITDPSVLVCEVAAIRGAGVGYDYEEAAIGVVCVAAPVLLRGQPVAALSISVPAQDVRPTRLAAPVRAAALALSRAIRGSQ